MNLPGSCFSINKSAFTPLEFDLIWLLHQWINLLFGAESLLVTSQKFLVPRWEEETAESTGSLDFLKDKKGRTVAKAPTIPACIVIKYTKEASWVQRSPSSSQRPYLNASVDWEDLPSPGTTALSSMPVQSYHASSSPTVTFHSEERRRKACMLGLLFPPWWRCDCVCLPLLQARRQSFLPKVD